MIFIAEQKPITIIDAADRVLGRLASIVAKKLLNGEEIVIVNAERAVISGKPENTNEYFLGKIHRGDRLKGPFYPRPPEQIFRRVVRGMLPWRKSRGQEAFRRLKVFSGQPAQFADAKKFGKAAEQLRCKIETLKDVSAALGVKLK